MEILYFAEEDYTEKQCSVLFYFMFQDLVKSHLMSAVRSEVEELRDKISKLEVHSYIF